MTCQECQPLAIDLARGLPPFDVGGAVQRADVLAHIGTCKRCAQWLREQEALSDALRATAAADASLSAPPGVEAKVMTAFRARQAHSSPSPARMWRLAWPSGRAAGFAAAAAIIFVTLTLPAMRWLKPAPGTGSSGGRLGESAGAPVAGVPAPGVPATGTPATNATVTGTNAAVVEVLPDKGRKTTKGPPAPPRVVTVRTARRSLGGTHTMRASSVASAASEFSGPAFVLLPYVEPLRPTEMRHIMRVRMTRAQFEAGELRASGVEDATVLADVLVGEDGTARAVRIVQ